MLPFPDPSPPEVHRFKSSLAPIAHEDQPRLHPHPALDHYTLVQRQQQQQEKGAGGGGGERERVGKGADSGGEGRRGGVGVGG